MKIIFKLKQIYYSIFKRQITITLSKGSVIEPSFYDNCFVETYDEKGTPRLSQIRQYDGAEQVDNLKPCPFCGRNELRGLAVLSCDRQGNEPEKYFVHCAGCVEGEWYATRKEAIRVWNRRAYEV